MLPSALDAGVPSPVLKSDRLSAGYGIERVTAATVGNRPKSAVPLLCNSGYRACSRTPLHPISP
jgi:hypothetical protein